MNHVITDSALKKLLASSRLSKGVCSTAEAIEILGISDRKWREIKADRKTKLEPSYTVTGKWILRSVKREFERIHGKKYEEAI